MMNKFLERYSRQILFRRIGEERQKALMNSSVLIVGCGALGTVSSSYLARAGVGNIRVVDRDYIEESNLQRQMLYNEEDIAQNLPKAIAAQKKLQMINSAVNIEGVITDINSGNVDELTKGIDIIIDGTDNFETRFLINDFCVKNSIPWIYGACIGSRGVTMNIVPDLTPCLRCVFDTAPEAGSFPTCDTAGILGPIAGIIASFQVTEAIKILTEEYESMNKTLLEIDVWDMICKRIEISGLHDPNNNCPACTLHDYKFLEAGEGVMTSSLCGRNAVQIMLRNSGNIDLSVLAERLKSIAVVSHNAFMLKFKVSDNEFTVFPDGRAIITGCNSPGAAKSLYSKYIGM